MFCEKTRLMERAGVAAEIADASLRAIDGGAGGVRQQTDMPLPSERTLGNVRCVV